ncbi:EAL domain-containing protein [Iodobacter sp.]|uniref:EAL domain-containing protein n=1 Tax=Iodobacter sp. TaxID=1915058 RepID=UPI0025E2D3CE|nr:EAL domain-containing protein [Iodobacter sp.]
MNTIPQHRWPSFPQQTSIALTFLLSIQLTLTYLSHDGRFSIFWIPSGIALAVILLGGVRYWPALFLGSLASDVWNGNSFFCSAVIALSVVLETTLDYYLLRKLRMNNSYFNASLSHARDFLNLAAIAIPNALLSACIGAVALYYSNAISAEALLGSILKWWMGNTLGILTITPLILIWKQAPRWVESTRKLEAIICFGLALCFGQVVFLGWHQATLGMIAYSYWAFLFVVWGATRFGRHGGLFIIAFTLLQALIGAIKGLGVFAHEHDDLINFWLYAMALNVVGVLLALLMNERKQAEHLAKESEERHRTLVEWSPEAIAVYRNGSIIYVNPAAIKLVGAKTAQDLQGQSILNLVHPDFFQLALERSKRIAARDAVSPMIEIKLIKFDGQIIDVEIQSTAIILDGKLAIHALIRDITKDKQADQYEQFRNHILELLAGGEPLMQQLDAIVRGVEKLNPTTLCSVLLLDQTGKHFEKSISPSLPDFYTQALNGLEIGPAIGSCGTAAYTKQRVIVDDIASHPYWANYLALAAKAQLGACWSQPILDSSGEVLGTFAIYHRAAHTPQAQDIAIIEQSAHLASIAIERNVVAEKLKSSEAHYRLLTENVSDVAWKQDSNHIITYISPADERLRGYPAAEVVGHPVFNLLTDDGIQLIKKKITQRNAAEQQGIKTGAATIEIQQRCKDGRLIWTEILSTPERNAQGKICGYHGITRDITQRRQAEAELRIAAIAFQSQEGMFVTDTAWTILRVNQAFSKITGFSAKEAIGNTPLILTSVRHDASFYTSMTDRIKLSGTWQGEIWNKRKSGEIFPAWLILTEVKTNDGMLTHYVATLTDITSRKAAENQIQSLAFYDPLTTLPNRRLLLDRLGRAINKSTRHDNNGALLFIDLDNFKTLNDTLGHDKGDLLLVEVAKRLSSSTREGDTVARLGGDEFVVMLEDLSANTLEAATEAEAVGDKIISTLNQSYQLAGYVHHSTASLGITLFGEEAESIDEPLKRADLAMYQAKAAGRNTLRFFDPIMQAEVSQRLALETGLRDALAQNQFQLYYQAQVKGNSKLTGVEALVRWLHPERGMVSPAEFIPLAEESGLILPLGQWVLETACIQLAQWASQAHLQHLSIAVNVSPRQFHQRDFVENVLAILARTGAKPQQLKLELTESVLIANIEDVILKMSALKQEGVGFAIDDFGTGYSSLAYLKRLPLDQLKIDQGFVRDILIDSNDAAIAKMVIMLADSLGLSVIAEGVETEAQRDFLARHGCDTYQGYLYSRPLPAHEFAAFALAELALL